MSQPVLVDEAPQGPQGPLDPTPSFDGVKYFLKIAFPLIISQTTDNIMLFMDRIFLSHYGDDSLYLNASLVGALTFYINIGFFITVVGYTNALVAQSFGANKRQECSKFTFQAILLSLFCFPLVYFISLFYRPLFEIFGHEPAQVNHQLDYCNILIWGSPLILLRSAISGFFSGLGNTKLVMMSHIVGMMVNIPLNFLLIFGVGPFPELGIKGAAYATIVSYLLMDIIFVAAYFSKSVHQKYATRTNLKFHLNHFKKLLRYGTPSGVEFTLGLGVFSFFIFIMNGYGQEVGTAVTIAINWDTMFFIPMLGLSFATTIVSGQHLGSKNITKAKATLKMALMVALTYALILVAVILLLPHLLIDPFINPFNEEIYQMSKLMLQLACIYLIGDAIQLPLSGLLRGAGDTKVVMMIMMTIHLIFGFLIYYFALQKLVTPIEAWYMFIVFVLVLALALFTRYKQGGWKQIDMLAE